MIGDNAANARTQGGGSATVLPAYTVSPLAGLRAALPGADVTYSVGAVSQTGLADLPLDQLTNPVTGKPGARVRFVDEAGVELFAEDRLKTAPLVWFGGAAPISESARRRADHPLHADREQPCPDRVRHGRPRPGVGRRRAGHRRGAHRRRRRPRRCVPHAAERDDADHADGRDPDRPPVPDRPRSPRGLPGRCAVVPVRHRAGRRGPRRPDRGGSRSGRRTRTSRSWWSAPTRWSSPRASTAARWRCPGGRTTWSQPSRPRTRARS